MALRPSRYLAACRHDYVDVLGPCWNLLGPSWDPSWGQIERSLGGIVGIYHDNNSHKRRPLKSSTLVLKSFNTLNINISTSALDNTIHPTSDKSSVDVIHNDANDVRYDYSHDSSILWTIWSSVPSLAILIINTTLFCSIQPRSYTSIQLDGYIHTPTLIHSCINSMDV